MSCNYTLDSSDLIVSHIIRLLLSDYSYIRVKTTQTGTSINIGCEVLFDSSKGSQMFFDEDFETCFNVSINLSELQEKIEREYHKALVFSWIEPESVLLMEAKKKVEIPLPKPNNQKNMNTILEYIYTHSRTILILNIETLIDSFYPAEAIIVKGVYEGKYISPDESSIDDLLVYVYDIESLDRQIFDVYYLHKDDKNIIYEITNKLI